MSTVEEIVTAVKELPREKQAEVWRRLYFLWLPLAPDVSIEGDLEREVVRRWYYLNSLSTPRKRSRARRPPIKIKGKPISETVIEDRR
jgi:hypothetical protein